jgi:nucleoside triphosphate pyrophosphatase
VAPTLVLASGSPRRCELLSAAGYHFDITKPDVRERGDQHLSPRELTGWNALAKGLAVARARPHQVILAADTLVALHDEIIGKPADFADAIRILQRLAGRKHHVYSSVFIGHLAARRVQLISEISEVRFRRLTDQQICDYLRKIDPLDKAGAYAAQGHGAEIIARIDGSYSNVVGLPMEQTQAVMNQFGIRPARRPEPSTAL